jgi:peroxiredoxin
LKPLEYHESLFYLTAKSSRPLRSEAIRQLRETLPNLRSFSVRGNQVFGVEKSKYPAVGSLAPQFSVQLLDGTRFHLRDERGKAVVLYFWATWCSPCVKAYPELKADYLRTRERYKDFQMIALSLDEDESVLRRYVEEKEPPWLQARIGQNSRLAAAYGVTGVPAYFLIGPDGRILLSPDTEGETLEQEVGRALAAGEASE